MRDKNLIVYRARFDCLFLDVYPVGMFVVKINRKIWTIVSRILNKSVMESPSHADTNPGLNSVRFLIPTALFNICAMCIHIFGDASGGVDYSDSGVNGVPKVRALQMVRTSNVPSSSIYILTSLI